METEYKDLNERIRETEKSFEAYLRDSHRMAEAVDLEHSNRAAR